LTARPSFFHHLHPPTIPAREARFRYTFGLGGISVYLFVILLFTGALETIYYIPTAEGANQSLQEITFLVPYGRLVRSLHFWSAQALVITNLLHMLRVVFTGAYKSPRRFNWLLGVSLLALVLLFNFGGYALRWDTGIAWALLVGTNLLKTIPLIGSELYAFVVGGAEIGSQTVTRFYSWHIYLLPLAAIFLIAWHLFRVRRDGGISRSASEAGGRPKIHRNELVWREVLALIIASILLLLLSTFLPPRLGSQLDYQNLAPDARAPWFFLWIQELLRLGSPFVMGVLLPLMILVFLAVLPYAIDRRASGVGDWFNRQGRVAQGIVLALVVFIVGFSLRGWFR
jgi:quinol-cytochrome oxidoreductase complex cytochrome b subunit